MRNMIVIITFIIALFLLNGCAVVDGYPDLPSQSLEKVNPEYDRLLKSYNTTTDKRAQRDDIINERMAVIDTNFINFEKEIYQQTIRSNIGVDWLLLTLGAATVAVSGSSTKDVLAATTVGVVGAKAAFDKRALADQTMPALLTQMKALRKEVQLKILKGVEKDVDQYSLIQAFQDLEEYYQAGTIPGAIIGVTKSAGVAVAEADKKIIEHLSLKGGLPKEQGNLADLLCIPGAGGKCSGDYDPEKVAKMKKDCWPRVGVPSNTFVTDFITKPQFKEKAAEVQSCMQE